MSLGNFMHSSVGFGEYGDYHGEFGADLKSMLVSAAGGVIKTVVGQLSGPVEISTPSELAGAKLTPGFKIIKAGSDYKIVLDTSIPGLSDFTGKIITGKDPVKESLAGVGTLEYIPPPASFTPIIIGVVVIAIAAVVFMMTRGGGAPAARKRKRKKSKRKSRKRRNRRRR